MSTVTTEPDQHLRDALPRVLAPLGELVGLETLTGGMFATTFRASLADGTRVVVKTAPTATDRLLTYEHDLLRTEALVYRLAEDRPDLLMPRVLLTDFSRSVVRRTSWSRRTWTGCRWWTSSRTTPTRTTCAPACCRSSAP